MSGIESQHNPDDISLPVTPTRQARRRSSSEPSQASDYFFVDLITPESPTPLSSSTPSLDDVLLLAPEISAFEDPSQLRLDVVTPHTTETPRIVDNDCPFGSTLGDVGEGAGRMPDGIGGLVDDGMDGVELTREVLKSRDGAVGAGEDAEMNDDGVIAVPSDNGEDSLDPVAEPFRYEWLGTSQFSIENTILMQESGQLDTLISQHAQVTAEQNAYPYDPTPLLTLAYLTNLLGFSDIAVGHSRRAILLLNAAFNRNGPAYPPNLADLVQTAISLRFGSKSVVLVGQEMLALRLQGYTTLITGLAGCAAYWDGIRQCRIALKLYPGDARLLQLQCEVEAGYKERRNSLPRDMTKETKSIILRNGKIFHRPYPWMDKSLYERHPKLVRDVNMDLTGSSLEVRRAFWGPTAEADAKVAVREDCDFGPLGIFAKRDIEKGELIMVDKSITGVSQINPSTKLCCEACHACLSPPFMEAKNVIVASCCGKVAYCGKLCEDMAMNSYHKVLCGKNFDWLFKSINIEGEHKLWRRWRAVAFLRIMAIIIADNESLRFGKRVQPLAHPLVARMIAAYAPNTLRPRHSNDWQFNEEVVIPSRILLQLGIDIYASGTEYSQETIQTIYWRCENNANQTSTHLVPTEDPVNLININQNYLFFNHSCAPNVVWHGPPDGTVDIEFYRGIGGEMLRPGESAVWCIAVKDIQKDEQCTISYIGDPLGKEDEVGRPVKRQMLEKWCEGGCGCSVCEEENAREIDEEAGL